MKKLLVIPFLLAYYMGVGQGLDSASIIGKPIIIGKLMVAQNDFPYRMNWDNAKTACASLGKDWRLPNRNELNTLFNNRDKIGGFENRSNNNNNFYWSSTEDQDWVLTYYMDFLTGNEGKTGKNFFYSVRAIQAL
ncbi:MAG: DUF1566 domain-containing protein [Bacteroidota bacterium]|jgi:hypothetical protein